MGCCIKEQSVPEKRAAILKLETVRLRRANRFYIS